MKQDKVQKIKGFLREVKSEGKKVTWPSRKELFASMLVVMVLVAIVAAYIGLLDFGFSRLMAIIIK